MIPYGRQSIGAEDIEAVTEVLRSDWLTQGPAVPRFEGELTSSGCWIHLSLEESEDGSILSGSARINTKISTRACRSSLAKSVKNGEPFSYALTRLK